MRSRVAMCREEISRIGIGHKHVCMPCVQGRWGGFCLGVVPLAIAPLPLGALKRVVGIEGGSAAGAAG